MGPESQYRKDILRAVCPHRDVGLSWGVFCLDGVGGQDEPLTGRKGEEASRPWIRTHPRTQVLDNQQHLLQWRGDRSSILLTRTPLMDFPVLPGEGGGRWGTDAGSHFMVTEQGGSKAEGTGKGCDCRRGQGFKPPHPVHPTPAHSVQQLSCTWRAWHRVGLHLIRHV